MEKNKNNLETTILEKVDGISNIETNEKEIKKHKALKLIVLPVAGLILIVTIIASMGKKANDGAETFNYEEYTSMVQDENYDEDVDKVTSIIGIDKENKDFNYAEYISMIQAENYDETIKKVEIEISNRLGKNLSTTEETAIGNMTAFMRKETDKYTPRTKEEVLEVFDPDERVASVGLYYDVTSSKDAEVTNMITSIQDIVIDSAIASQRNIGDVDRINCAIRYENKDGNGLYYVEIFIPSASGDSILYRVDVNDADATEALDLCSSVLEKDLGISRESNLDLLLEVQEQVFADGEAICAKLFNLMANDIKFGKAVQIDTQSNAVEPFYGDGTISVKMYR